ncbi:MAG TPA: cobalt ECF transporter T component CbiQ [Ruminiclostridium sp.]
MSDIMRSMFNVKHLDELSRQKNLINDMHPLAKLIITLVYICTLASFDRYEISGLLPFVLYPMIVIMVCDIPFGNLIKRVLIVEPFIIVAGILNPIFDKNIIEIGGFAFSSGWLTFVSLILKSTLMVTAGFLLIATTGIDDIARALSLMRIPSIFVLLFLLTYRYIFVLMDEAGRLLKAYALRAPDQKGVKIKVWGSMVGQLLIRTYNRAQTIYQSMILKGYNGKYSITIGRGFKLLDAAYFVAWVSFIVVARAINIPLLIAALI